jgi:hypothetical protein
MFHPCSFRYDNLSLNLHTTPFDVGGTAKSRNFEHAARIDGERMDHSRCLYPKFIG